MGGKSSTQCECFLALTCPLIMSDVKVYDAPRLCLWKLLSPNYSKIAVERDRNSKNSQHIRIFL